MARTNPNTVDGSIESTGRTVLELTELSDGSWVATQRGMDVEGTGETGAFAAMEFCRKVAEGDDSRATDDRSRSNLNDDQPNW